MMDSAPNIPPEDDPETPPVDLEGLFMRYRSTGRPGLLSEVFRHTSAELFSVALHLTRSVPRAEDLVQCTFVEVIGSARNYSPGRRVLPWLMGILSNVARAERRRQQRPDPERVAAPRSSIDPLEAACDAELREAVERCLVGLEEPYRNVLQLHLTEGLTSPEIASRVSRSPATVRSQIARGLGLLQQRLPQRFAWGAMLGFAPGRGMDAVEASVMAQARRSAPGLAVRGGLARAASALVRRPAIVALGCIGGVAVAVHFSGVMQEQGADAASHGRSTEVVLATTSPSVERFPGVRAAATRDVPRGAEQATGLRVQVQVHGRGLGGVMVRVQRAGDREGRFIDRLGTTDPSGAMVMEDLPAGAWRVELDRAQGSAFEVEDHEATELAFDLSDGLEVWGTVVDSGGAPVQGAELWWSAFGHPDSGMVSGLTDSLGRFCLPGVDPNYCVAALHAGHAPSTLASISSRLEGPSASRTTGKRAPIVLQLGPPGGSIHGRVVAEDGAPIENALVRFGRSAQPFQVIDDHGGPPVSVYQPPGIEARTNDNGEYRLAAGGPGDRELFIRARGFEGTQSVVSTPSAGVIRRNVWLRRGATIEGRLTDRTAPLRNARVTVDTAGGGAPGWFSPRAQTGEGGRFRLTGVSPGAVMLLIEWGTGRQARVAMEPSGIAPRLLAADVATLMSAAPAAMAPDCWISIGGQASDGLPLAGLIARTRREGAGGWEEWPFVDGAAHVGPLAPGEYRVIVSAEKRVSRIWEAVVLTSQSSVDLGTVDLVRGGNLVLDPAWEPLEAGTGPSERWSVRLFGDGGRLLYHRSIAGAGRELPPLPVGRVQVSAWGPGRALVLTECYIREGETTRLVLPDPVGAPQVVEVVPIATLHPAAVRSMNVTWFARGLAVATESLAFAPGAPLRFQQVLAPGEYHVRVEMGSAASTAPVTVSLGTLETLRIVLESPH